VPTTGAGGLAAIHPVVSSAAGGPAPGAVSAARLQQALTPAGWAFPQVVRVPQSIDSIGAGDVTPALNSFFASVPDYSTVLFPAGGRYRVDGTLELTGYRWLTIDGQGSTFSTSVVGSGQRAHWRFQGGSGLTVRNLVVRGADTAGGTAGAFRWALQWQHGIDLRGVTGVTLQNVTVTNVYGDCFYLGMGSTGSWSSSVRITGSTCQRNGRQGLAVTAARGVMVENSRFDAVGLNTFDLEPNGPSGGASGVTFSHNRVDAGGRQVLSIAGDGPVQDVRLDSTIVSARPLTVTVAPALDFRRSNIAVTNNISDTSAYGDGGSAFDIEGTVGITVTGNVVPLAGPNRVLAKVFRSCRWTFGRNSYPGGVAEYRTFSATC
jgi:hypothetical protein